MVIYCIIVFFAYVIDDVAIISKDLKIENVTSNSSLLLLFGSTLAFYTILHPHANLILKTVFFW